MTFLRIPLALFLLAVACLADPPFDGDVVYPMSLQDDNIDYRLPKDIQPVHYDIKLEPNFDSFQFSGTSDIKIKVGKTKPTKIVLHNDGLKIDEKYTKVVDGSAKPKTIKVTKHQNDEKRHFLTLTVDTPLEETEYTLKLSYTGVLNDDLNGFYRSYYLDSKGKQRWIATTHFEPIGARRAFPCWDEPALKATFAISIKHTSDYTMVVSNMPQKEQKQEDGKVLTIFETTPAMSTYLVAFVVSDYEEVATKNKWFRVLTRSDMIHAAEYALKTAEKVIDQLDEFTDLPYFKQGVKKMDQITIPHFSAGAMENWGLVTYRESSLLYEENITTTNSLQGIGTVISHEFAHQWFGNIVSPKWWTWLWLNEGFATFFQYYTTKDVEKEWELEEQFPAKVLQASAFVADAGENTQPLNRDVSSPEQIKTMFDSITYQKGGSVIRMMMHFLTEEVFRDGLREYLKTNKYKAADSSDLFKAFESVLSKKKKEKEDILPKDLTLTKIMETWVNQRGYPVVFVNRTDRYEKKTVEFSQERFFLTQPEKADSTRWYIPLNFATKNTSDFNNTEATQWLKNDGKSLTITGVEKDDWIIVNNQQTGFYRVNYDDHNWDLISKALSSDEFHKIHVINRAQLVDDALNLARAGQLSYVVALELVSYLERETNYIPWIPAFSGLGYLNRLLVNSEYYNIFKAFVATRLKHMVDTIKLEEEFKDKHTTKLLRVEALKWSCEFESQACNNHVKEKLELWLKDAEANPFPTNLRSNILCAALRHADENTWNMTLERYHSSKNSAEKSAILSGLGCSTSEEILAMYLDMAIDPETKIESPSSVISAVYSGSAKGVDIALDFISANIDRIKGMKNVSLKNLITDIGKRITTVTQYGKLSLMAARQKLDAEISETGIKHAKGNLDWIETNEKHISKWLKEKNFAMPQEDDGGDSATSLSTSIFLVLVPVFLSRFY